MRSTVYFLRLFYLSALLLLLALLYNSFSAASEQDLAARLSAKIEHKLDAFAALDFNNTEQLRNFYHSQKAGLYIFKNDSLRYWNNARIPLSLSLNELKDTLGCVNLRYGTYIYGLKQLNAHSKALMLSLLKPNYSLQNNYLSNDFEKWTELPKDIKILALEAKGTDVTCYSKPLFKISGTEKKYHSSFADEAAAAMFILAFLLMTASLLFSQLRSGVTRITLLLLGLAALRSLLIYFSLPEFLYRSMLYDVRIFGDAHSQLNAYLGDMLINSGMLTIVTLFFQQYFIVNNGKTIERLAGLLPVAFVLLSIFGYTSALNSLVKNSTIQFDLLNAINLQWSLFFALAIMCLYGLSFFIGLMQLKLKFEKQKIYQVLLLVFLAAVSTWYTASSNEANSVFEKFWPLVALPVAALLLQFKRLRLQLALAVFVLVLSLLTSQLLSSAIKQTEEKELELLSYRLSERLDPMLESEFAMLPERLSKDENIKNLLRVMPAGAEGIELQLRQHYFSGYFDRYQIDMQVFDAQCTPLLMVGDGLLNNAGYFEDMIMSQSDSTATPELFFVSNYPKNTRYIAKIVMGEYKLYVRMDVKQYEELGTFPDLLLDRSQQGHEKLNAFSHAVYRANQMTSQYGDLSYPVFLPDSVTLSATYANHLHHYYYPEENTAIIISERLRSLREFFTSNSYLLLYFALLSFFCFIVYTAVFTTRLQTPSLTRRIQSTVIVLLLVSMSAIGYTSAKLVRNQFEDDNKRELEEKTQIILAELSANFSRDEMFDESRRDLLNLKLREYARLFNTPVTLFSSSGQLFTTSEEKLYDLGLAARLINPLAFDQISNNRRSSIPVTERAGSLSYISFYTPILNKENRVVGYINLPYFARQSALLAELSGIVSALVNVYVLLFVLSLIAGLILSGYITQPLRLIQQQIAKISLGKQNEKITWNSKDEIGKLVDEYNAMLLKLENSANLLAQSERESAWREMAKQVAHEIKNPLTPMKLNLQYLQHVVKSNDDNFKEKFNSSAAAIIEQIDALASIATEFSNFARLPSGTLENIDLQEIVKTAIQLFGDETKVRFIHHLQADSKIIYADKDQCLRVLNNIIKNAIQACAEQEEAIIEISYALTDKHIELQIKDNGCGIAPEEQARIFEPNFTTKTTGSGLGLSMVKNIMQGFGGSIRFESEPQKGTSFFLLFPLQF